MDVERLEARVLTFPLQELRVELESGVYILGNSHAKPAWWSVRREPTGRSYQVRGLQAMLALIEQTYPDFYAWLVRFSQGEEEERRARYGDWSLVQESEETGEI